MESMRSVLGQVSVAIPMMAVDAYIPASLRADADRAIKRATEAGAHVRLIRLPINDMEALKARLAKNPPTTPYRPTFRGFPVDYSPFEVMEVISVFRDDTNTHTDQAGRLIEEWKPPAPTSADLVEAE